MPRKPVKRFTAWSFSRYNDYKSCPRKAFHKYLDPDAPKEPPAAAMARGSKIHKQAEDYVSGVLDTLPRTLENFTEEFEEMLLHVEDCHVELELAYTKDLEPCSWRDWNNCWLRVKVDLVRAMPGGVLKIIDHKTGSFRPGTYTEQLELYQMAALLSFEGVKRVDAELWFLDQGEVEDCSAEASELPTLIETWKERTNPMMEDTTFEPTPSANACRFCFFSKNRGGPCQVAEA